MNETSVLPRLVMGVMKRAGRAYIAGPELEDAIRVALRLASRCFGSTICYWDAKHESGEHVSNAYLACARALHEHNLDCYLSIKAPSVQYDWERCARLLNACGNDRHLHFDSLGPETADPTFELVSKLLALSPNVTCTLPGRWARSLKDAEWAIEAGVGVRVVKGQWEDAVGPPIDPEAGYLRVVDKLAGRGRYVAVATHDPKLAGTALQRLLRAGTPCELELLFGLPVDETVRVAQDMGVNVRLYIPYGYGWLPYSLSQASQSPRILYWLLKDLVCGKSKAGIYNC